MNKSLIRLPDLWEACKDIAWAAWGLAFEKAPPYICSLVCRGERNWPLESLDDFLRYNAVGMFIWIAVVIHRDFCDRLAGRVGGLSALCSAAYLLASKPGLTIFGVDADLVLFPLAVMTPAMAWLFGLSQFDDKFRIGWMHLAVCAAKFITGAGVYLRWRSGEFPFGGGLIGWTGGVVIIGLLAHLTYTAWQGRTDDLVENRRSFRSVFVAMVIVISGGVMVAEVFLIDKGITSYLLLLQSSAFLAVAVFLNWRISAHDSTDLFFRPAAKGDETAADGRSAGADQLDLDMIMRLEAEGVVLEQGLTIARMADKAGMPEHRLRRLINQHLGYRNFSDYLNHHRIAAAQERLASVEDRNLPVLTIAMDLGYGSLGPFNRAFKERTGQTPTEFRRSALA